MRMIFAFIVLISFKITEVKGECFLELLDKTFEHSDGIVGPEFHKIEQTECHERCLNMYECIAMTYEFESSTCRLFKFIPNTNIEKEKEINCQGRCITRYIAIPKYCYEISNSIPVYVRFVNQLSDCYAFANLCKSNIKLQDDLEKVKQNFSSIVIQIQSGTLENMKKVMAQDKDKIRTLENKITDLEQYKDKMEDKIDAMIKDKIRTLEKRMNSMEQVKGTVGNLDRKMKDLELGKDKMRKLEEKIDAMDKVETITYSNGVYTGMTRNGKKHGLGTYKWSDGTMYVGNHENGEKHGYGVYLWSDGRMYSGQWDNGNRTGIGYFNWPDGQMYVGLWKDDLRTGNGHYFWLDGDRYAGEWKDNNRHGRGFFMYSDGRVRKGQWRNNKEV